jgi:hypothetical protein
VSRNPVVSKYATAAGLWRAVDGAVKMTFDAHPDYLSSTHRVDNSVVRRSLVKRIVGGLLSSPQGRIAQD